jgi:tetratricopeptide (TPR) repeat protein
MTPGRLAEQIDRLAYHALQGGLWEKAVLLFRKAGAKAAGRSAYREAVTCFEQALGALGYLAGTSERSELAVNLRFDLHNALIPLGDVGRMADMLNEAEREAELLQDQRRLGQAAAYMTQCYWWTGQPERAVESGQRAITIAQALGDHALEGVATQRIGQAYASLGEYRRAIEAFGRHLARVEAEGSHGRSGIGQAPLGRQPGVDGLVPRVSRRLRRERRPRQGGGAIGRGGPARPEPRHDLLGSGPPVPDPR